MNILVTNDDGINAPGLLALVQAMKALGNVLVVAPDHNWSASGHVKTLHRPLRAWDTQLADGTPAMASDGAPSDCVALAVLGLIDDPIHLVVSGINPNANLGHDLTYSGTVTAAMEAAIWGLPGVAVSVDGPEGNSGKQDFTTPAAVAQKVVRMVQERGMPPHVILNVNVPSVPANQIKGYRITSQGLRIYRDVLVRRKDPRGRPYYWIGGDSPTGVPEEGTDVGALAEGCVSITPIHLDMTAHQVADELEEWKWE